MSEKQNHRRKKARRRYVDKMHESYETARAEAAVMRLVAGRLLETLEGVRKLDRTGEYWECEREPTDHERPPDGERWRTPRELADAALEVFPLAKMVGAGTAALARERLIMLSMHVREMHQAQQPGCQCQVCKLVPLAIAGMASDAVPPAVALSVPSVPDAEGDAP